MASGNPARKAAEKKISQVGDFKKRVQSIEELPSGLVVKLRNPGGLDAFLGQNSQGEIPNSLMPIIQKALKTGQNVEASSLTNDNGELDMDLLLDMQKMMDNIAVKCMIDPDLQPKLTQADVDLYNRVHKLEGDNAITSVEQIRREDLLYVDELPDEDKQYIFAWLSGGVKDLEQFREQQSQGVDALAGITIAQGNTK